MTDKNAYCFDNMKALEISHTHYERVGFSTWAYTHTHICQIISHVIVPQAQHQNT